MATKKYLDYDGVKYLWSKINGKVDNATESLQKSTIIIQASTDGGGGS